MDRELELIRFQEVNKRLLKALPLLTDEYRDKIQSIIDDIDNTINVYNNENFTIINPSKKELASVNHGFKSSIFNYYNKSIIRTANEYVKSLDIGFDTYYDLYEYQCECEGTLCTEHCDKIHDGREKAIDFYSKIRFDISSLYDKTEIPDDLIKLRVKLSRWSNCFSAHSIEGGIAENIRLNVLKIFNSLHEEYIMKNILTTSP